MGAYRQPTKPSATPAGKCRVCGTATHRLRHKLCRRCYRTESLRRLSTPLRRWRERSARDFAWLALQSRVSYRTIMRIAAGEKPSAANALAIHRVTRIPLDELLRGGA